jgi:hypothetical protein
MTGEADNLSIAVLLDVGTDFTLDNDDIWENVTSLITIPDIA